MNVIIAFVILQSTELLQEKDFLIKTEDGIKFYYRTGDEEFVKELIPLIKEARKDQAVISAIKYFQDFAEKSASDLESLSLDKETGRKLFNVCSEYLSIDKSSSHKQSWQSMQRTWMNMKEVINIGSKSFLFNEIKIVSKEDVAFGKVPFFYLRVKMVQMAVMELLRVRLVL